MRDKTISIIILLLVFFLFGCETYSGMYKKLKEAGLSEEVTMYVICKKDNKDLSKCNGLVKLYHNTRIFKICGGQTALDNNELKFLKCVTNLK